MLRHTLLLLSCALAVPASAQGLKLKSEHELPLRARVNVLSSDEASGSRLLGAQLLGDYYLTSPDSGLRLSGGWMVGPQSLLASGLAPARQGVLGVGHRRLLGSAADAPLGLPYLGVGFSHYGAAWGVTADLGVAVNGAAGVRLGSSASPQNLDDTLRRLQWTPTLQLGVSYRF